MVLVQGYFILNSPGSGASHVACLTEADVGQLTILINAPMLRNSEGWRVDDSGLSG
ncbi:MAG: hypothetical protein WA783_15560 [Phormidesmis sp.]